MRSLVAVLCQVSVLVFLAAGCADEAPASQHREQASPPPRRRASGAAPDAAVPAEYIDVAGVVATDLDDAVGPRTVVLVDGRGERRDALTDDSGGFVFAGVRLPYDLMVVASSGGPTVYLGLRRPDPYVELFERDGPTPAPPSQTIRVGVRAPSCGAPSCWVTVVTASASGAGTSTTACNAGENEQVAIDVQHDWHAMALAPGELIGVHVLVGDDDRSSFAYAHVNGIAAAPGDATDVGMTQPVPVPVMDPVAVGARGGAGDLDAWSWTTEVSLDVADASGFVFAVTPGATMTTRLPLFPGAAVRVNVAATHPHGDARVGFHRSTEAWSGARPLSAGPTLAATTSIELDVAAGPEPVRPAVGGIFSRHGLGFAWKGAGIPALALAIVADTARGALRFRVLTTEEEVPLARLSVLGLPKLLPGDHLLDLTTAPLIGIDDTVSPDAEVRRRRIDRTRRGGATYLRIPFQVTR